MTDPSGVYHGTIRGRVTILQCERSCTTTGLNHGSSDLTFSAGTLTETQTSGRVEVATPRQRWSQPNTAPGQPDAGTEGDQP